MVYDIENLLSKGRKANAIQLLAHASIEVMNACN